jgi:hypothetical protein
MIEEVAYDANGNKIEEATYDKNMFLLVRNQFNYDSKQHLVGTSHEGSLDKVTIKYSRDGQELSRSQLNENSEKLDETAFQYDEKGKLREADDYNAKGEMTRRAVWTYEYDKHGFCTKETEDIVDSSSNIPRHSQIVTTRNIKYIFTIGGLFESAGEAFGIVIVAIMLLFGAISATSWCIESLHEYWLRKSSRKKGSPG